MKARENYFALAKMPFDSSNNYHRQVLIHINSVLTGAQRSFEEIDWEAIGFQNKENISTDFRATGMLGLLNVLFLLKKRGPLFV